jgi:hypothetical protein
MRFLITAGAGPHDSKPPESPSEKMPFEELFAAYMRFNEEMARAGVLVAAEGLNPAKGGARVGISNGKRVLLDGPFTESKELVGGFYLIDVSSLEEAIAWALRCPIGLGSDEMLAIHPMTELSDIPPHLCDIIREVAPTWSSSWKEGRHAR